MFRNFLSQHREKNSPSVALVISESLTVSSEGVYYCSVSVSCVHNCAVIVMPKLTKAAAARLRERREEGRRAAEQEEEALQDTFTGLQRRLSFLPAAGRVPESVPNNLLLSVGVLQQIAAAVSCSDCGSQCQLQLSPQGVSFTYMCVECGTAVYSHTPACVVDLNGKTSRFSGNNLCIVYETLVNGSGFNGFRHMCSTLSLTNFSKQSYYNHASFLLRNMDLFQRSMQEHVKHAIVECQSQEHGVDNGDIIDISVSYDGTWMTRGHRSHIGVGFVIECDTGFVIDFEVLSNFCLACKLKEKSVSEPEFLAWKETSRHLCTKNFNDKSGAMEAAAAVIMWQRSEARGFRYRTFVGDGDSSAFDAVMALNGGMGPYQEPVLKEECVNHVSKRVGTRLRNLKKDLRVQVKTKAGKTIMRSLLAGALTDASIDKMSHHYGLNIRAHDPRKSVADLRTTILSGYYHASSTDENPKHACCPAGADSWCWWRRAEATGETPASHKTKKLYLARVKPEHLKHILQVYTDLTSAELLQRCLKRTTQNANESLHSKLWLKCLKIKHAGLRRVRFAASVTVLEHNFGSARGSLLAALGLLHEASVAGMKRKDKTPVKPSARKKRRRDDDDEAGPSSTYTAGAF